MCSFQAEDGIRYLVLSRGLGDVYKRQLVDCVRKIVDPKQLEVIAKELGVESTDNPQADNFEIRNRIGEKRPPELDRLESILKITGV